MIAVLTGTSNSPLNVRRMPGSYTGDFPQTLMRLARKFLGTPSAGNALETMALGDSNDIDHLVLLEDAVNVDWLLKQTVAELDFIRWTAAVDLDFHQVRFLLFQRSDADLGMSEDTDDRAVLLDTFEFTGDGDALVFGVLLGVFGESLLLRPIPVLVESPLDFIAEMF